MLPGDFSNWHLWPLTPVKLADLSDNADQFQGLNSVRCLSLSLSLRLSLRLSLSHALKLCSSQRRGKRAAILALSSLCLLSVLRLLCILLLLLISLLLVSSILPSLTLSSLRSIRSRTVLLARSVLGGSGVRVTILRALGTLSTLLATTSLRASSVGGAVGSSAAGIGIRTGAALQCLQSGGFHVSASSCDFIS